jgi:hypothetical protein
MVLVGTATPIGGTCPAGWLSGNTRQITGRVILFTIPANTIAESISDLKQYMQKNT